MGWCLAGSIAALSLAGCLPDPIPVGSDGGAPVADLAHAPGADLAQPAQDFAGQVVDLAQPAQDFAGQVVDLARPPQDFAHHDFARPPSDLATPVQDLAGADLASACINLGAANGSGHHNPGRDCPSCHTGGGGPTLFTVAGTLYDAAQGGAAIAGATVEVIDANGKTLELVTASNGNFYTSNTVAFPLAVRASGCPNDAPMVGKVQNGSCNASGCHDSTMRVHLP